MERLEFLKKLSLGTVAFPLLISCKDEDDTTPNTDDILTDGGSNTDCVSTPTETAGPFPIKDPASLVRKNIIGDRSGIDLDIEITILDLNNSCVPLEGAIVDIWHCDKDGYYSEYGGTRLQSIDLTDYHFLRGRQVSDANGKVAFTSIFPGWYQGRATHIHVHVYDTSGKSLLVTQIAFPEGNNSAVVQVNAATDKGYTKGMNGYLYNADDNEFRDGVSRQIPSISGSLSAGFSLTHNIIVSS